MSSELRRALDTIAKPGFGVAEASTETGPVNRAFVKRAGISPEPPMPSPVDRIEYLMGFAVHAASASKDETCVGAALVGQDGEVRLTGYNGPPKGVRDLPGRFSRPAKYLFISHAEENLIAFAAREGIRTKGCAVFTTHHPCAKCARTLIQAGIAKVFYGPGKTRMPPEEFEAASAMFYEAGIQCEAVS